MHSTQNLCRIALASPYEEGIPAYVMVGCVTPALALAKDHLDTLLPSTWRLLIDLLLRLGCVSCAPRLPTRAYSVLAEVFCVRATPAARACARECVRGASSRG
jgi:hypothetical protein